MITDIDRTSHEKSRYDRPTFPWVCGRACIWGKPCPNGPNDDGTCGGVTECQPYKSGERWDCRRPMSAGGPCDSGPLPDGSCSQRQPPCRPRRSLRRLRGRATFIGGLLTIALIAAFLNVDGGSKATGWAALNFLNPGPLSRGHSSFAMGETGCTACHKAHGDSVTGWLKAIVQPASTSESCVACHRFGGKEDAPHNRDVFRITLASAQQPMIQGMRTECAQCHTEHKGIDADIAGLADAQCSACHKQVVTSFSTDHPPFAETFPQQRRSAIAFDHVSHFNEHFVGRMQEFAPDGCVGCHQIAQAGRTVPPGSYRANCAACHDSGIVDRELLLVGLPLFEGSPFDQDEVAEVCPVPPETAEQLRAMAAGEDVEMEEPYEFFFEDFGDYLGPVAAYLIGAAGDDPDAFGDKMAELLMAMGESGQQPLADVLSERLGEVDVSALLAGLEPGLARNVACAWMQHREYIPATDMMGGGWYADAIGIRYRPTGHADPVARAWLNMSLAASTAAIQDGADDEQMERAESLRDLMLSQYGVGYCTKCHAVTAVTDGSGTERDTAPVLTVEWEYQPPEPRPYVDYDHRPHIDLLGPGTLCTSCHVPDPSAEFAASYEHFDPTNFAGNFRPISKQTCTACHAANQVRQDCLQCHEYHLEPGFNKRMGFEAQALESTPDGQGG